MPQKTGRHILIADDSHEISDLVSLHLGLAGYTTTQVFTGTAALKEARSGTCDLVLLDVMMPGMDGFAVLDHLCQDPSRPAVIMMTARTGLTDRVRGLTQGADDYICKPFEIAELLARIEVALRKQNASEKEKQAEIYRSGDFSLDAERHQAFSGATALPLTAKEYEMLLYLLRHPNKALSREQLLEAVWGYGFLGESRTVDLHVQRLRKKLDGCLDIATVYKFGYRLNYRPETDIAT